MPIEHNIKIREIISSPGTTATERLFNLLRFDREVVKVYVKTTNRNDIVNTEEEYVFQRTQIISKRIHALSPFFNQIPMHYWTDLCEEVLESFQIMLDIDPLFLNWAKADSIPKYGTTFNHFFERAYELARQEVITYEVANSLFDLPHY